MKLNKLIAAALLAALVIPVSVPQPAFAANLSVVKKAKGKKKNGKKRKNITLAVGASKTLSIKTKKKVKWSSSNRKVVTVKEKGKNKALIRAKKKGNAKVTAKQGNSKWIFNIMVKGNKKAAGKNDNKKKNSKVVIEGIKNGQKVEIFTPGEGDKSFFVYTENPKSVSFKSSNEKVLKLKTEYTNDPWNAYATCTLIPYSEGSSNVTVTYPGGKKKYQINIQDGQEYAAVKNFIAKVNASNLDDAHKALVIAKWLENRMTYGRSSLGGVSGAILEGKGVCSDYADTYNWLLGLAGIKARYVSTLEGDHGWSQIQINGKWYNVDTTADDATTTNWPLGNKDNNSLYSEYFMKSDYFVTQTDYTPFNNKMHKVSDRLGGASPEKTVLANATDYDDYDWLAFAQSQQFKDLTGIASIFSES